jgi:LysM repeat protein
VNGRTRARVAAPAAFLLGVTIAVLLVRAGLEHHPAATTTTTAAATTHRTTTQARTTTTTVKPPRVAGATYVTIQSGDTFYSLATAAGISVSELEALNPGVSPYAIHVGQRIRVK